jgi:hypothetical protein
VTKQTADHRHLLGAPIRDRILDEVRTYVDAAGQMGKIVSIAIDGTSRIVGDVDTAAVTEVAGWITPVPGGVGPVTVAVLMRNAVIAHQRQRQSGWRT